MPDSTHRDRLATAQQFITHVGGGDLDQAMDHLAEQVTYRAQGHNALAGLFVGRDAVARHLHQFVEHHVVGLASVHAQSNGRIYKGRTVTVVRFNVADEIEGITVFFEDQNAIDRFIGP
jgi:hypothetical protein